MLKNQIGIWLDLKEATIISFLEGVETIEHIASEIEDFRPKGGSRSKQAYGPMEKVSEKKYLMRRKQQMNNYFKTIKENLKAAEEIFVFGPAETKNHFAKNLEEDTTLNIALKGVETADSMTKNQMIAKVKEVFSIE